MVAGGARMQSGIRCGARLTQRMEMDLFRQLASGTTCSISVSLGITSFSSPSSLCATRLRTQKSSSSAASCRHGYSSFPQFLSHFSQLCSGRLVSALSFKHGSCVIGERFEPFVQHISTSRVASSPRVTTSFHPEDERMDGRAGELVCPGCGVQMQDENPKAPGFFKNPAPPKKLAEGDLEESSELAKQMAELEKQQQEEQQQQAQEDEFWLEGIEDEYGGLVESRSSRRRAKREKYKKEKLAEEDSEKPVVCARCHALRNYGKVKDETVENLLPDFDFENVVGDRLRKSIGRRAVVLMVIDAVDFDGSFPRTAATLIADAERELAGAWQEGKSGNVPRLVICLNKVDLLPGQISPVRLEQWVRRRSRAGGVSQISGVHVVSAYKGWGVDKLAKQLAEMAGPRGDVWVIGAQNVGKSSLINALAKFSKEQREKEKKKVFLTEAAVPGTTIGLVKLEGILPGRARVLDTPGLLHPHQITTRLTREEQKLVQIRKVLKPRTFRVKVGHAITVGGLMRVTLVKAPADSIYATVWTSASIPCHMGQAEKSTELFDKHIGDKLTPPLNKDRVEELGRLVSRTVQISGEKWDQSSVDVAVAGVGWIALALSGSATLEVCTWEGVAVTVREAMVFDMAAVFERPGFTAVKTASKAGAQKV
ncbi:hypothetical protein R1flu_025408 [Riccia fluitans]|uniref:G domain-containing protein n=1 Tax=Riccia fluitans TaxID=41844 RepID=A0ABD1XXP0_9MARC